MFGRWCAVIVSPTRLDLALFPGSLAYALSPMIEEDEHLGHAELARLVYPEPVRDTPPVYRPTSRFASPLAAHGLP